MEALESDSVSDSRSDGTNQFTTDSEIYLQELESRAIALVPLIFCARYLSDVALTVSSLRVTTSSSR